MSATLAPARTRTFTPHAQIEAGLVWVGDLPTWPTTQDTTQAPAPTQEIPADLFNASGADLRKLAYTPTGRTRVTPQAQAALAEIARRAARKAARKAAR